MRFISKRKKSIDTKAVNCERTDFGAFKLNDKHAGQLRKYSNTFFLIVNPIQQQGTKISVLLSEF